MLSLMAEKLLKYRSSEGVLPIYPFFFTKTQQETISNALRLVGIPVVTTVDDITSMGVIYGAYYIDKILKGNRHVLFVDIGGTTVKAYGEYFMFDPQIQKTMINETVSVWTEKTGGYFFAKSIAAKRNMTIREAEKLLIESSGIGYENDLDDELQEIARIVDKAATLASATFPIDEIQLIGGGSNYHFIKSVVSSAANISKASVLHDFNSFDAIARGATLGLLMSTGNYKYKPIIIDKHSPFNIFLQCEDRHVYCQHGDRCTQYIMENIFSGGCDELKIVVDERDIGEGVNPLIASYVFTNLTLTSPNATAYFTMNLNQPTLQSVKWCVSDQCQYVGFSGQMVADDISGSRQFVEHLTEAEKKKREITKYMEKIQNDAEAVVRDLDKVRSGKADMFGTITKSNEKKIRKSLKQIEDKSIFKMELKDVKKLADDVEKIKTNFLKANTKQELRKVDEFPDIIDPDSFSL